MNNNNSKVIHTKVPLTLSYSNISSKGKYEKNYKSYREYPGVVAIFLFNGQVIANLKWCIVFLS